MRASLSSASSTSLENLLTATLLYVMTARSIIRRDYEKALRLGERLLDSALTSSEKAMYLDSAALEADDTRNRVLFSSLTLDKMRACVLYADTLSYFNSKLGAALKRSVHKFGEFLRSLQFPVVPTT